MLLELFRKLLHEHNFLLEAAKWLTRSYKNAGILEQRFGSQTKNLIWL